MPISHDKRRAALQGLGPVIAPNTLRRLDDMSDATAHANALADSDAPPSTTEQLDGAREARRVRLGVRHQPERGPIAGLFTRIFGG